MTSPSPLPADYRDLGLMLKDTREGMGLSLEQVTQRLRIRLAFLQALEKGDLAAIPGDVYARGYLKTYADFLGYDGAEMIGRIAAGPIKPQATKYLPPDRSAHPNMTIVVIIVCGLALAAAAWWQMKREKSSPAPELVEKLPENLSYLLDKGTPRIGMQLPESCVDVRSTQAVALCESNTPMLARLADDPAILGSVMELPERFPVWASPAATVSASDTASHSPDEPLWMNPFRNR